MNLKLISTGITWSLIILWILFWIQWLNDCYGDNIRKYWLDNMSLYFVWWDYHIDTKDYQQKLWLKFDNWTKKITDYNNCIPNNINMVTILWSYKCTFTYLLTVL